MPDEPIRPFRWDLVRPDQLGSMLDDVPEVNLDYLDELIACAGKVLARCGDGDLYFVGRSVDSLFDLLSGAFVGTSWQDRLHPLPLSLPGTWADDLTAEELAQLRTNLAAAGLAPADLMRGRPTVFVDLVSQGFTFENLYELLRDWIADEHAQWDVIRRQLRFVGITRRGKTSPNKWRWQQEARWTAELPASSIRNVSLDGTVWSYFGDYQAKTAGSFWHGRWSDPKVGEPRRDKKTRYALAEAALLVERGKSASVRRQLAAVLGQEPSKGERWSRELQLELRG
ncbi:hypothetical protein [Kribbella sp. NPDC051718]|uniref:hypothetical protein n=1 Tax=Kribbella sp. NPDC051718 TaxID=3155168 RepID=UPI00341E3D19